MGKAREEMDKALVDEKARLILAKGLLPVVIRSASKKQKVVAEIPHKSKFKKLAQTVKKNYCWASRTMDELSKAYSERRMREVCDTDGLDGVLYKDGVLYIDAIITSDPQLSDEEPKTLKEPSDRVMVKVKTPGVPEFDNLLLVPGLMPTSQFKGLLKKHVEGPDDVLATWSSVRLYIGEARLQEDDTLMSEIYNRYADKEVLEITLRVEMEQASHEKLVELEQELQHALDAAQELAKKLAAAQEATEKAESLAELRAKDLEEVEWKHELEMQQRRNIIMAATEEILAAEEVLAAAEEERGERLERELEEAKLEHGLAMQRLMMAKQHSTLLVEQLEEELQELKKEQAEKCPVWEAVCSSWSLLFGVCSRRSDVKEHELEY